MFEMIIRRLKMIRISFNGPWKNLLIVLLISFPQRLHNLMMMCLVYLSLNPKLILCLNFICVSKRVFFVSEAIEINEPFNIGIQGSHIPYRSGIISLGILCHYHYDTKKA